MPYMIAHSSFAFSVGEPLGCCPDAESRAQFALGSLGPDPYFFDRIPPTPFIPHQKRHGNRLHNAPCDALCRALLRNADDSVMPYVYGFLTHIALDSTMHPYICSRYSGNDHTRFEGDIDAVLYARYRDRYDFRHMFSCPKRIDRIDRLVTDVSTEVLGAGPSGAFKRSTKKLLRLYPVLLDQSGRLFRLSAGVERLLHKEHALSGMLLTTPREYFPDCMNESHVPWFAPAFLDVERRESVDELFDEARALATQMLQAAQRRDVEALCALVAHRTMDAGPTP